MQFRVYNLEVAGRSDVASADSATTGHIQTHLSRAIRLGPDADALDVEQQLHDFFFHPGNRRVLVYDVVNLHPGNCAAGGGTKQNPPHRIAKGKTKTPFQGLNGYLAVRILGFEHVDIGFYGFRCALGGYGSEDKSV